jgi:hypothetical protein
MARATLKLGLCWHIGDGKSVRITEDLWLPLSTSFRSFSARDVLDKNERVSLLINEESQSWNSEVIHSLFSDWEAGLICSIPLPPRWKPDRLFWNETSSGLFFVKSAYFLQLKCRATEVEGQCSSVEKDKKFWKFLWALSLPPKIKMFLWRACVGVLPTYELLWRRHMRLEGSCPCCLHALESVDHILWACPVAVDVWLESNLKIQKWDRFFNHFFDLMMFVKERLSSDEVELFACIAYFIWNHRNWVVHDGLEPNPQGVVRKAKELLQAFKDALPKAGHVDYVAKAVPPSERQRGVWLPPSEGRVKVNWEIFKHKPSQVWYVGALIRNHEGHFMAAMCSRVMRLPKAINPCIGACFQTLQFTLEAGFSDVIFEGPQLSFLDVVSMSQMEASLENMWAEDVWGLVQEFRHFTVSPGMVGANRAELVLAQSGCSYLSSRVWLEVPPVEIMCFL